MAVGTHMSITCLKPVVEGPIEAEAVEISRSRKLVHRTVRITDAEGQLVALFQGTAYIKGGPYPPSDERTPRTERAEIPAANHSRWRR